MNFWARVPRILVIDNSPGDVLLLQRAFSSSRIMVTILTAWDVSEGLQILREQFGIKGSPVDLVLYAQSTSSEDGHKALAKFRERVAFKDLPVMILSPLKRENDLGKEREPTAASLVTKPRNYSEAMCMVRNIASRWLPAKGLMTDLESQALFKSLGLPLGEEPLSAVK